MAKKKRKTRTAVGQLIGQLAAEYGRLSAEEARQKLGSGAAIVASRRMVLRSVEDLELLETIEDNVDLSEARKRLAQGGDKSIPWRDVKKKLGL